MKTESSGYLQSTLTPNTPVDDNMDYSSIYSRVCRYARKHVSFGEVSSLYLSPRHRSGLNQTGRYLQRLVSSHTNSDVRSLAAASVRGDTTALRALQDKLDEIEHPGSGYLNFGLLADLRDAELGGPNRPLGTRIDTDRVALKGPPRLQPEPQPEPEPLLEQKPQLDPQKKQKLKSALLRLREGAVEKFCRRFGDWVQKYAKIGDPRTHDALLRSAAESLDPTTLGVFADHLDEQGQPGAALARAAMHQGSAAEANNPFYPSGWFDEDRSKSGEWIKEDGSAAENGDAIPPGGVEILPSVTHEFYNGGRHGKLYVLHQPTTVEDENSQPLGYHVQVKSRKQLADLLSDLPEAQAERLRQHLEPHLPQFTPEEDQADRDHGFGYDDPNVRKYAADRSELVKALEATGDGDDRIEAAIHRVVANPNDETEIDHLRRLLNETGVARQYASHFTDAASQLTETVRKAAAARYPSGSDAGHTMARRNLAEMAGYFAKRAKELSAGWFPYTERGLTSGDKAAYDKFIADLDAEAARYSGLAAGRHEEAAESHRQLGEEDQAAIHDQLAEAHRKAAAVRLAVAGPQQPALAPKAEETKALVAPSAKSIRAAIEQKPKKFSAYRSPAGGLVVRGLYYSPGSFTPDLQAFASTPTPQPQQMQRKPSRKRKRFLAALRKLKAKPFTTVDTGGDWETATSASES